MAITKIYRCDICSKECFSENSARIKFIADYNKDHHGFKFCFVNDNSASEKIICRNCIQEIKEAKWECP